MLSVYSEKLRFAIANICSQVFLAVLVINTKPGGKQEIL